MGLTWHYFLAADASVYIGGGMALLTSRQMFRRERPRLHTGSYFAIQLLPRTAPPLAACETSEREGGFREKCGLHSLIVLSPDLHPSPSLSIRRYLSLDPAIDGDESTAGMSPSCLRDAAAPELRTSARFDIVLENSFVAKDNSARLWACASHVRPVHGRLWQMSIAGNHTPSTTAHFQRLRTPAHASTHVRIFWHGSRLRPSRFIFARKSFRVRTICIHRLHGHTRAPHRHCAPRHHSRHRRHAGHSL